MLLLCWLLLGENLRGYKNSQHISRHTHAMIKYPTYDLPRNLGNYLIRNTLLLCELVLLPAAAALLLSSSSSHISSATAAAAAGSSTESMGDKWLMEGGFAWHISDCLSEMCIVSLVTELSVVVPNDEKRWSFSSGSLRALMMR